MSSFHHDDDEEEEILQVKDYDWSDITPIKQEDGPDPVAVINYDPEYVYLMDLFRGILAVNELSHRVLQLTEELIEINPASYTVWQYRRSCLKALNTNLYEELDYLDNFAEENPKNYQLWYHRRAIIELLKDPSRELSFTETVFEIDAKNYHAWCHRQWVLKTFHLFDQELFFIDKCLEKDIRNNSAWNQRWFVVHDNPSIPVTIDILQREIDYTFQSLEKVKKNESAWNYLRGIVNFHAETLPIILPRLEAWINTPEGSENYHLVSLYADLRESEGTLEGYEAALFHFKRLMDLDAIRVKSWIRRINAVNILIEQLLLPPDANK
eukprot:gene7967-8611_t